MANEWDEYAEGWNSDPSVQEYALKAFNQLNDIFDLDGMSVFDFGCGTGALSELLSPRVKSIVALDGSKEMVKFLAQKNLHNVSTISEFLTPELIVNNALLSKQFDLIVASSVCGFLPDYEQTVSLLKSLLVSGGTFIQWDWLAKEDGAGPGLTKQRIATVLANTGFTTIDLTTPFKMTSSKGTMQVIMAVAKAS